MESNLLVREVWAARCVIEAIEKQFPKETMKKYSLSEEAVKALENYKKVCAENVGQTTKIIQEIIKQRK